MISTTVLMKVVGFPEVLQPHPIPRASVGHIRLRARPPKGPFQSRIARVMGPGPWDSFLVVYAIDGRFDIVFSCAVHLSAATSVVYRRLAQPGGELKQS
jgi:hypothetical protein